MSSSAATASIEYMEVDLKNDSTRKDLETQTPVLIPCREDSLERMQEEENHIFTSTAPSPKDKTIDDDELNRLHRALGILEQKEYALICSLYFDTLRDLRNGPTQNRSEAHA